MVSSKRVVASERRRSRTGAMAGRWITAVLAGAAIGGVPAHAGPAAAPATAPASAPTGDPPAVEVSYGDLDLSTSHGAQALLRRITAAAARVCPSAETRDLEVLASSRSCRRQAIARAVRDVGSPRLASLSGKRPKRGAPTHG